MRLGADSLERRAEEMKHFTWGVESLDKPASEKQMNYLASLITDVKREFDEPEARALVDSLVVPEELTSWEASSLITIFKRGRSGLPGFVLSEERRRSSGGKVKSTLCEGVALRYAMPKTYAIVLALLKK